MWETFERKFVRIGVSQKCNTTLFVLRYSLAKAKTPFDRQFGWGGTPLKRYQQSPKVGSDGSEIRRRVQEQKPA
jgi:hypothetical protein